ncbi:hypothetical protein TNCV_2911051 [Trichonephila clavipes]|nr:hypothetical protein TNCV_2911051 [Trichonephila clavipes]
MSNYVPGVFNCKGDRPLPKEKDCHCLQHVIYELLCHHSALKTNWSIPAIRCSKDEVILAPQLDNQKLTTEWKDNRAIIIGQQV